MALCDLKVYGYQKERFTASASIQPPFFFSLNDQFVAPTDGTVLTFNNDALATLATSGVTFSNGEFEFDDAYMTFSNSELFPLAMPENNFTVSFEFMTAQSF